MMLDGELLEVILDVTGGEEIVGEGEWGLDGVWR